jgi:hypothetical protein
LDSGGGPDADAGHRGHDFGKRVCTEYLLDCRGELVALPQDLAQAVGELGQDSVGGGRSRDHHGLLVQGGQDPFDEAFAHAGRVLGGDGQQFAAAGFADPGRAAAARQQLEGGLVGKVFAEGAFPGGMDLAERPRMRLVSRVDSGQVVIETDQDFELCRGLVADINPAKGMRQSAGRVSDHVGVAGVDLALPGCRSAIRRIASPGR